METIINYSIGIIGTILTIYSIIVQLRSNKKKEPVISMRTNNLISGYSSQFLSLKVLYNEGKIENFSSSIILLYNRGAETITAEDIDTVNHLRVVAKEGITILDASILQENNPSNQFKLAMEYETNEAYILCDYIDQNQGIVIQVLHTGLSSDDLDVVGDIKGVERIIQTPERVYTSVFFRKPFFMKNMPKILLFVGVLFITVFILMNVLAFAYPEIYQQLNDPSRNRVFTTLATFFAILAVFAILDLYRDYQSRRGATVPSGLETFNEQ
jgi:hypothetical protein